MNESGVIVHWNSFYSSCARLHDRCMKASDVMTMRSDEALRRRLLQELLPRPWWHACSNVIVDHGVAHLWGVYAEPEDRDAARCAAEKTPGVRRVEDHRVGLGHLPSMG